MRLNVVMYQPEIPQNTGNIMRTCVGTNTKLHLIRPLGFHLDEKHLQRSAVDYFMYLDYEVYDDWNDFLTKNPNAYLLYATRYGHKPLSKFDLSLSDKEIYLVFGRESTGIPYELLANNLDYCYRLPTTDKIRALNVSNCVAISVYEVLRQNDYMGLFQEEPESLKGAHFLDQFKNDGSK